MSHFTGSYSNKLDKKGKVSVPSRFRGGLGDKVVLAQGLEDRFLRLYPAPVWEEIAAKIEELPKFNAKANELRRSLIGTAHEVVIDPVGRIQIPQALRNYAGIDNRAVTFVGMGGIIEVWEKELRDKLNEKAMQEKSILAYMEEFGI